MGAWSESRDLLYVIETVKSPLETCFTYNKLQSLSKKSNVMLQSLHQHENSCLTVNLHLFVRLSGFYPVTGGLVNTDKHDSHHCFTSGYYVQRSIMLYFVKFVGHRKKNKLLESWNFVYVLFLPQFISSSDSDSFFALGLRWWDISRGFLSYIAGVCIHLNHSPPSITARNHPTTAGH